jgi:hypothetical protein
MCRLVTAPNDTLLPFNATLPVMFAVPLILAPVPVTTKTFAVPVLLIVTLPLLLTYTLLLPSDWMVVKSFETGQTMNTDWSVWRQTIRDQAGNYITSVKLCKTINELELLPPVIWEKDPNYTN